LRRSRRVFERRLHALVCALLLALASCGEGPDPNLAPSSEPVVGRAPSGGLELRWSGVPEGVRYEIHAGPSPDAIDDSRTLGTLTAEQPSARIEGLDLTSRHYFELRAPGQTRGRIVAERRLPLEGSHNFRDLGGYATADGRRVRWGKLFRSDHLGGLTDTDVEYLKQLDLALVCDFRGEKERADNPDRLPSPGPKVAHLAIADDSFDPDELQRRFLSGDFDGIDVDQLLVVGNQLFATTYSDRYHDLFERLLVAENQPTLVHCTAGKDRAGFASALILSALGVPEETIFDDYLRTNLYSGAHVDAMLNLLRVVSLFRTHPDEVRPLLSARREYLQAAFDAIRQEHGSLDIYLEQALGVDPDERKQLQDRLLE